MKCKYCGNVLYDQFWSNKILPSMFEFNDISKDLWGYSFIKAQQIIGIELIDNILETENLEIYKEFDFELKLINEGYCSKCRMEFNNNEILYMRLYLKDLIDNRLQNKISRESIKRLGYDFQESYGFPNFERTAFIDVLKDEDPVKEYFNRLQMVYTYLGKDYPDKFSPEKGGDGFVEFLKWLTSEIPKEFAVVLVGYLFSEGKRTIQSVIEYIKSKKYDNAIKKRIKKKIMSYDENTSWDDITIEDLKNNFCIPKDFKGNPNDVIDKIANEKIEELKKDLLKIYEEGSDNWFSIFKPKGK